MINIILVTPWNFLHKRGGSHNRVLGLVNAISKMANVLVLHQGPDTTINGTRFFHYDPLLKNIKRGSLVVNVINCYASSTASLKKIIQDMASITEVDIIQVEHSFPFYSAFKARNSLGNDIVLSLDQASVYYPLPKIQLSKHFLYSLYSVLISPFNRYMESYAVNKADYILCVSNRSARLLKGLYNLKDDKVFVVPNGVDSISFEGSSYPEEYRKFKGKVIFFHGSLSWHPNVEAVEAILDVIAPRIENSTFVICGPDPSPIFLKKISKSKKVRYVGYVDRLPSYIKGSDLCIAPFKSGVGTKLKVLEYAAAGKPIVATYKAVEGLPFCNGYNALLYDIVDDEFIKGMKRVLSDEELGEEMGRNAKKTAQKYDWKIIARDLVKFYEKILDGR